MITLALLSVLGYPILWILSFIPAFSAEFVSQVYSAANFFASVVGFAWGWRNWIPLHLIAVCAGIIFSVWILTITLSFLRVIYSMFFGGGGSK